MEQKPKYALKVDQAQLAQQAAVLEQDVFLMCAGAAGAVVLIGDIRGDIAAGEWDKALAKANKLKTWLMQGHEVANTLTIVSAYLEFLIDDEKNAE